MANIKIDTRFGELTIDPAQVITFPQGIPGFEDSTKWKLFHEVDERGEWVSGVVVHLQSVSDRDVSLSLTDPSMFGFSYDLVLTDSEVAELKLEDPEDVLVLTVLSIRDEASKKSGMPPLDNMYANISAPILINTKSQIGIQKILMKRHGKISFNALAD
ncbi:MAG: flagellar assembly protein FliW [Gallionella sp.]|nr:flagellar assembly protein FliW [Gallionella sp.]